MLQVHQEKIILHQGVLQQAVTSVSELANEMKVMKEAMLGLATAVAKRVLGVTSKAVDEVQHQSEDWFNTNWVQFATPAQPLSLT